MSVANKNKKSAKHTNVGKRSASRNTSVVTETVGNYEKHPFFVKKANAAKELLQKVGLPGNYKVKVG